MEISTKELEDVIVVEILETRLDAQRAVDFKQQVHNLIQNGHELLVLDLSKVEFIDSSGLGAMVSCLKAINRKGELALLGISDKVLTLFQITRMDRVFQIFSSETEAVTAISRKPLTVG